MFKTCFYLQKRNSQFQVKPRTDPAEKDEQLLPYHNTIYFLVSYNSQYLLILGEIHIKNYFNIIIKNIVFGKCITSFKILECS